MRTTRTTARTTWTFQPSELTQSLLKKAINQQFGRGAKRSGLRSKVINRALEKHFAELAGKREMGK